MMDFIGKKQNDANSGDGGKEQAGLTQIPEQKIDSQKFKQANQAKGVADETDEDLQKVDIERYKDPEGLTIKKMAIGLWLLKHRRHFLTLLKIFLSLVGVITWSIFIYTYGHYIIFGMKEDERIISGILEDVLPGHDYFLSIGAKPVVYYPLEFIKTEDRQYDFVFKATNPNNHYIAFVTYTINAQGEELGPFSDFILPGDTKHILSLNNKLENNINGAAYSINTGWWRINKHLIPDWESYKKFHLNFEIKDINFTPSRTSVLTEKVNLNNLQFVIANRTPYNYWEVDLNILLMGRSGILGANIYQVKEFMSSEIRAVEITWPGQFGRFEEILISPNLNILADDIYIDHKGDTKKR